LLVFFWLRPLLLLPLNQANGCQLLFFVGGGLGAGLGVTCCGLLLLVVLPESLSSLLPLLPPPVLLLPLPKLLLPPLLDPAAPVLLSLAALHMWLFVGCKPPGKHLERPSRSCCC
jgi:hypothetical protein